MLVDRSASDISCTQFSPNLDAMPPSIRPRLSKPAHQHARAAGAPHLRRRKPRRSCRRRDRLDGLGHVDPEWCQRGTRSRAVVSGPRLDHREISRRDLNHRRAQALRHEGSRMRLGPLCHEDRRPLANLRSADGKRRLRATFGWRRIDDFIGMIEQPGDISRFRAARVQVVTNDHNAVMLAHNWRRQRTSPNSEAISLPSAGASISANSTSPTAAVAALASPLTKTSTF